MNSVGSAKIIYLLEDLLSSLPAEELKCIYKVGTGEERRRRDEEDDDGFDPEKEKLRGNGNGEEG